MEGKEPPQEIVQILFNALNSRDLSLLHGYLAEDSSFDFPGTGLIYGREKILLFFKILFRKYRRLTFSVVTVITEEDRACALWTNEGEDKLGKAYSNRGITFLELKAGQIIFLSDYFKDTSFVTGS